MTKPEKKLVSEFTAEVTRQSLKEKKINKFFESKIFLEIVQKIANAKVHIEILLTQSLVSRSVVLNKVSVDYKCFLNTNHVLLEH